jgi:hypothetical protein
MQCHGNTMSIKCTVTVIFHLVALVRAGAVFKNGKLIERPDGSEGGDQQVA